MFSVLISALLSLDHQLPAPALPCLANNTELWPPRANTVITRTGETIFPKKTKQHSSNVVGGRSEKWFQRRNFKILYFSDSELRFSISQGVNPKSKLQKTQGPKKSLVARPSLNTSYQLPFWNYWNPTHPELGKGLGEGEESINDWLSRETKHPLIMS